MTAKQGAKRSNGKRKSIEIQTVREATNLDDSFDELGDHLFSQMESPPIIIKNIPKSPRKTQNRGFRGGKLNRNFN